MTNPVLTRNTTVLRGTGATVQGIALITLLYLGKYEPYYAFVLTVTLIWLYLEIMRLMGKSRRRK